MLHPQAVTALAADAPTSDAAPVAEARARMDAAAMAECGVGPALALVDEMEVGGVPCRRYHPAPGRLLPVVVYMHGGWTLGKLRGRRGAG